MKKCYILLLLVFVSCEQQLETKKVHISSQSYTIAFGSCNKEYLPQPLWPTIIETKPSVWIWLGDIIYADTENMELMKNKYDHLLQNKNYADFTKKTSIIGMWDDHDYGVNNGGKEYAKKKMSQKLLLDFLQEPKNSSRRSQEGIYASYEYGDSPNTIKVILLDTRYHRDSPGKKSDILGEKQWLWLQKELENSKSKIHIICSSIQIISRQHRYEKWANFPSARKRLFALFKNTNKPGIILLSGDRHFAEICKIDDSSVPYPLYEVTSSGMTHTASIPINILRQENTEYRTSDCFNELHFGTLAVDWQNENIILCIRDKDGKSRLQQTVPFSTWK